MTPRTVVQLTTGLTERAGGPYQTVAGLTKALAADGRYAPVVAGAVVSYTPRASDAAHWGGCPIVTGPVSLPGLPKCGGESFTQQFVRSPPAVVHVHGLWDGSTFAAMQILDRVDRPLVMSPRGMLEPWALGQRWLKKRLFLLTVMRRVFARVDLLHATSDLEAVSLRQLGLRQPIAVIPNGVDTPAAAARPGRSSERRLLYLGRLHVKKGLENLLQAWAHVRPAGWRLAIAGIDEDGYQARLMQLAGHLGIAAAVEFAGPRLGDDKWSFLATGDAFVHPSFSENFGVAVAEALAAGLPAIATVGTPWQQLPGEGCGWWVEPSAPSLAAVIRQVTAMEPSALQAMGQRGRNFVSRTFHWQAIGRKMADAYDWLTGRASPPDCLVYGRQ